MENKNKYNNAKIYAIRSNNTDRVYYGSTYTNLSSRMAKHRYKFKIYKSNPLKQHFITSFEILKFEDAYIELVEYFPCNTREELLKKEGLIIRNDPLSVNRCIAGRSHKQYYEVNKEAINKIRNKKCICLVCLANYTQTNKAQHAKTKKHQLIEAMIEFIKTL